MLNQETAVSIAFPDEGAFKRFHNMFTTFPTITCTKIRDKDKRIITVKDGNIFMSKIMGNHIWRALSICICWTLFQKSEQLWEWCIHINKMLIIEPSGNSIKSEPQMGFKPMTLCDLVGCSYHWATGDWWNVGLWLVKLHIVSSLEREAPNCLFPWIFGTIYIQPQHSYHQESCA